MGSFNTIVVRCHKCDHPNHLQSKAGTCSGKETSLLLADNKDVAEIEGEHTCTECGYIFEIAVKLWPEVRPSVKNVERLLKGLEDAEDEE